MRGKIPGLLLAGFLSVQMLYGQETGTVSFFIHPPSAIIRIDGALLHISEQSELELAEGSYAIEIWAPKFVVFHDTINIVVGENLRYLKGLNRLSPEFHEYRKSLGDYNQQSFINTTADILVLGFNAGGTYYVLRKSPEINRVRNMAEVAAMNYENAITLEDAWVADQQYKFHLNNYEKLRKNHNLKIAVGIPVMIASYGATAFYMKKRLQNKRVKPTYEEQNPFAYLIRNLDPGITYAPNEISFNFRLQF